MQRLAKPECWQLMCQVFEDHPAVYWSSPSLGSFKRNHIFYSWQPSTDSHLPSVRPSDAGVYHCLSGLDSFLIDLLQPVVFMA